MIIINFKSIFKTLKKLKESLILLIVIWKLSKLKTKKRMLNWKWEFAGTPQKKL
jgi:hypothetical protein